MEKDYRMFVEKLRQELIRAAGTKEASVVFKSKEEHPETDEDRLYLFLRENNEKFGCGIFTKELFCQNVEDGALSLLAEEVLQRVHQMRCLPELKKTLQAEDYEEVKHRLFIRLLNWTRNKKDLEGVVYDRIGDIALVLYQKLGEQDDTLISVKIREDMLEAWQLDRRYVMEKALLNTCCMAPPRFYVWKRLMDAPDEYEGESFMELYASWQLNRDCFGNCLSTTSRVNGAVAVFYPGVAEKIAKLLDSGFYMAFTSIHEVMIHSDQSAEPEELRRILRDTIKKATPPREVLSFRIYHYDRDTGEITWE